MDGICWFSAGLLAGSRVIGHGHSDCLVRICSTSWRELTDPTAPMAGERGTALEQGTRREAVEELLKLDS